MHVAAGAKGGKMRALSYKLQEVLDLLPIAWESGARIFLANHRAWNYKRVNDGI